MIEGPAGLTVDDDGNVYIVEGAGNVVRRVSPDGIITTVAGVGGKGEGQGGYSGDAGPATGAELAWPVDGAIDHRGNIYIADRDNSVVRRVDALGVITTFAGGGTVDVAAGGPPYEGPATDARFGRESPISVVVDAVGNVYISDEKGHRILRADAAGRLSTYVGTGQPGFSGDGGPASRAQVNGPYDLAINDAGNLFFGDYENSRIRRVDADGVITTVAGNGGIGLAGDGGPATEAELQSPYGLAVDDSGNVYIADQENALIRVVDPAGIIRTLEFAASPSCPL
jgi:sugar lactone lactonase YvrE